MLATLFKHSGIYSGSLIIARLISFAAFILFARHLGPDLFGRYIFFITLVQVITFIGDAGLGQWYQKNVTENKRHHFFAQTLVVRVFTMIATSAIALTILYVLFGFDAQNFLIFIFALFFEGLLSIGEFFYFEKRESHIVGLKQIGRALLLVSFYYLASHVFTFTTAIVAYVIAAVITCAWFFPWRVLWHVRMHHVTSAHKVFVASYPYALLSLTSLAYARADSIIIGVFSGTIALGIYSTAYRFLESLSLLPQALTQNLFPISAKKTISQDHLYKLISIAALIGGGIAFILFFFSNAIILTFFGTEYVQAVSILQILSIVLFLFFINAPLSTVVQSSHLVKKFLPYGVINTLGNILLNILFIPLFGIAAAACIMLFTEITGLLINYFFIKKLYKNSSS